MVKYTYINNKGLNRSMTFKDINIALRMAARHHESIGQNTPYSIVTDTRQYSHTEILKLCTQYGYLRSNR